MSFDRLETARSLALLNPRLALALLRTTRTTTDFKIQKTFYNPAVGLIEQNALTRLIIACDFYVYAVYYTLSRPNSFPGSIFKGQADYYNAKISSGILCRVQTQECEDRILTDDFQPLETVATLNGEVDDGSHQFFLPYTAGMYAEFQWGRVPTSDDNPTTVTLIFRGMPLGCRNFDGLDNQVACSCLRDEYGIETIPRIPPANAIPVR
jgi:hypothetical protein